MHSFKPFLFAGSIAFGSHLLAGSSFSEGEFSAKVSSSLLIKDYSGAEEICRAGETLFPSSNVLQMLKIRVFAESGQTDTALELFKSSPLSKDIREGFFLMESLAWGILLHNTARSEMGHISSLVGAYMTHDARAVSLIFDALCSSNALLRVYAAKFACQYNDRILQKKILDLLEDEKNWFVRKELITAVGRMRLVEAAPILKEMIANRARSQEEKGWAIEALIQIYENIQEDEVEFLLKHNRSGFREFGIALIDHFERKDLVAKMISLLKDPSPSVRIGVMCSLGTLDLDAKVYTKIEKEILTLMEDIHPAVSIVASWTALKFYEEKGRIFLGKWVLSDDLEAARFAASVIAAGGKKTAPLIEQVFHKVEDSFVKANLCIGMIKQGINIPLAAKYLKQFLLSHRDKMMWKEGPLPMFRTLMPSDVRHVFHMAQYPVFVDQLTKLDLVNLLSLVDLGEAKDLLKQFLKEKTWGIIGSASVALLEGGDLEAIDVVRELLHDDEDAVRIQAALALAFYGHDPSVVGILQSAYERVDWDKKVNILEALGFIGERSSIPFLLKVMEEPFGLLRTIAASSVIQCLYH